MLSKFFPKQMCKIARNYRMNMWSLIGKERVSKEPLNITYIGNIHGMHYMGNMAFGNEYRKDSRGKVWLWDALVAHGQTAQSAPMQIVEMTEARYRNFARRSGFYVPMWVNGELDLAEATVRFKTSRSIKEDRRKIKKNKLRYEITRDEKQFKEFYQTMYLPYIQQAHGDTALFHSQQSLKKKLQHNELLLVRREGEALAGGIVIYESGKVRVRELGVKNGNRDYLKTGVVSAVYYFTILYLKKRGYNRLNLGGSRAWLHDGVLQFKRKWGYEIDGSTRIWFLGSTSKNV